MTAERLGRFASEDVLQALADAADLAVSTLTGLEQSPRIKVLRRVAVELLQTEAALNPNQIAGVFGRTRQWA